MEVQEEFMGSNDLTQIVKGKRTKRHRSSSPYKVGMTSSSSSGCDGGGEREVVQEYYNSISSPTTTTNSNEVYESTEAEEDMANCLILLAQGEGPRPVENSSRVETFSSRKFSDVGVSTTTSKAGFYVYECKTCNRSFPSFQALGGHRASHKKPKMVSATEEKRPVVVAVPPSCDHDLDECQLNKISPDLPPLPIHIASVSSCNSNTTKGFQSNNKVKIHECTICGSQFASGQALGGHMRRHRPNVENQVAIDTASCVGTNTNESNKIKSRNILSLDLNLPAPEDDHLHSESQFKFASTQQVLVFSAPALVDCHY